MALFNFMSKFQRNSAIVLVSIIVLPLFVGFGYSLVSGKLVMSDGLLIAILMSCAGVYYLGFKPKKIPFKLYLAKSTLMLIAGNLVLLAFALTLHWSLFDMLVCFWTENVVIGIYTMVKILFAQKSADFDVPTRLRKITAMLLFALHYFAFCLLFFTVIVYVFNPMEWYETAGFHVAFTIDWYVIIPAVIVALVQHGASFKLNFLDKKEFNIMTISDLAKSPYKRVLLVLMAVLCVGLLMRFMLAISVVAMVLFYLIKTIIDARRHVHEHNQEELLVLRARVKSYSE